MKKQNGKQRVRFWRKATLLSVCLLLALCWIPLEKWILPSLSAQMRSVEIPNFCGMVAAEIEFSEWLRTEIEYRYDENTPAGVVLSQTPAPGSRRKLSEANPFCDLTLVVSMGTESLILPDVVGQDVREASAFLRQEGFSVETVMESGPRPAGEVLATSPRVGTELPRGSVVTLTVSAGKATQTVTVPNVCGLSRSDALIQLWLCQLTVEEVVETNAEAPAGTVFRQSHQPNTVVMAGTKITLYVSAEASEP
ncbi:MAG: PASTA domain-containing protein [Clostridia bacterium]|nr:PASTA domain-containing protein [Clostridia bacterium]